MWSKSLTLSCTTELIYKEIEHKDAEHHMDPFCGGTPGSLWNMLGTSDPWWGWRKGRPPKERHLECSNVSANGMLFVQNL